MANDKKRPEPNPPEAGGGDKAPEPQGIGNPVQPSNKSGSTTGTITVCVTFEISGIGNPVQPGKNS